MKKKNYNYLLVSIVGLFFGVMVCVVMFKTPSIANQLAEALNTDIGGSGMLFTVYTIVSCVFAIPCVFLVKKLGTKKLVMIGAVISIIGSLVGALSITLVGVEYSIMLFSRCLEGICYIFVSICVPVMVGYSVPKEKKGLCLSIFAAFIPIGCLIGNTFTSVIVNAVGISTTWIIYSVIFAVSALLVFFIYGEDPSLSAQDESTDVSKEKSENPAAAMDIVMFLCSFGIFCLVQIAIMNFYPKRLVYSYGFDLAFAGLVGTLPTIVAIVTSVIIGRLSDKQGTFKKVYVFALIVLTPGVFLLFAFEGPLMFVGYALCCVGLAAPAVHTVAAMELFSKENAALGIAFNMGVCCLFQAGGNWLCQQILGEDLSGWMSLAILLGVLSAASVVFAMFCKPGGLTRKERAAQKQNVDSK